MPNCLISFSLCGSTLKEKDGGGGGFISENIKLLFEMKKKCIKVQVIAFYSR